MGENDRRPDKIDVDRILDADEAAGSAGPEEIELLDPASGRPLATAPAGEEPGRERPGAAGRDQEQDEYYDLYIRTRADFENYRKRIEREQHDDRVRAGASLVLEILPVVDNLQRAVDGGREGDPLRDGVALILKQLRDCLGKAGLQAIDAVGEPFNPVYHEAVATERRSDFEPNTVIEVIQQGYTFHGRVLRPSLVRVAIAAAETPSTAAEAES